MDIGTEPTALPPIRLGIDRYLARHERLVDLLGPLLPPRRPRQWVHRPHGLRLAERYAQEAPAMFELTDELHRCDFAVLPFGWDQVLLDPALDAPARAFCRAARDAGKVVLAFVDGDDHIPGPGNNAVVFRTSLDRRRQGPLDVPLPAWIPDPGLQAPRRYCADAIVGFCGQAYPIDLERRRVAKRAKFHGRVALTRLGLVERLGKHPAFIDRPRAVRALAATNEVDTRITLRPSMTRLDLDTSAERQLHTEYLRSLAESDYVLAVRGEGNYSFRLYEALAAGRVPLYLDTDAVLPLESLVPWAELCVVVPQRDARRIGEVAAMSHAATAAEAFVAKQAACRVAWERWLSMEGFFRTLHQRLSERVAAPDALDAAELAGSLR